MANLFKKVFGDENTRALASLESRVAEINALEEQTSALSDDELKAKTPEFKVRLEKGESLDDILPEAFAVVREVSKRISGQRHFDVQLMGGIVIHEGNIAEMRTGEGKTLSATAPVYLNALAGRGVHVITVNDFLARRDAVWMGQIYTFLGLSVGAIASNNESYVYDPSYAKEGTPEDDERDEKGYFKIDHEFLRPVSRPESYKADITYGTNSEFGFDYLRDNLSYNPEELRQREPAFALIDEIDSVLIDEARTPLIISAPAAESEDLYSIFADIAKRLKKEEDYTVDEKKNAIQLTDSGIEKAEKILGVDNIYTEKGIKFVHHLETAVRANALYHRDKEYVVRDGNIVIIDQFTGRMMPSRRFSGGLHQALEAKESVDIQRESRTYASITYQNFFRQYEKLAGMTGTAKTSEEEFQKVYGLDTIVIPTNVPTQRADHNDQIFQTEEGKFKAISRKVKELHDKGQPILIGTVSIEKNELLAEFLDSVGITPDVLNAKKHEKEGEVIAQAGRKGAVTIATNMAGRGVDIKLGGDDATEEQYEEIKSFGGLFVLGTERHEARRIDDQLRGRAGRQGDPGETQFYVSLEDELMRVFASDPIKKMMGSFGIPDDQPIENKMITRALENAQEKIEGLNFDARKHVLQFDDVLNQQRQAIYSQRHEILTGSNARIIEELERISLGDEDLEKVIGEKREAIGDDEFINVARRLILQTIDMLWVEHLETMEFLRSSVNLRAYGQKDPLIEYKKEGLLVFREMQGRIDETVAQLISGIGEGAFQQEKQRLQMVQNQAQTVTARAKGETVAEPAKTDKPTTNDGEKIGRNDRVKIQKGGETKIMKYKKAEPFLEDGWELVGVAE